MKIKGNHVNMGLVYAVILCFIGLVITAFYLSHYMNHCNGLYRNEKVLIKRLAAEVYENKMLKHENDSLKDLLQRNVLLPVPSDSVEVQ